MATSTIHTVETFSGTLGSTMKDGTLTGFYDPESGVVHINFCCRKDSDIGTGTTLFTIPTRFRPSDNKNIPAVIGRTSSAPTVYNVRVASTGAITQSFTSSARYIFGSGSYKL